MGQRGYLPNLALKLYLKQQWEEMPPDNRLHIAKIIVSDWGGVRANHPDTLKRYINALSEHEPPTSLQGVASYSKIFSIVYPDRFAIYDARVAACLNAVQINSGLQRGLAFNYVPGRNSIVGTVLSKEGFTQEARFSTNRLVKSGWIPLKRDHTYTKYLEILCLCLTELRNFRKSSKYDLVALEMALFANAESECQRATAQRVGPP